VRTARIVVLKGAADVAARGAGLVTFPVLAANAGAAGYGAYALVATIASFVIPFASLGLGGSMVRFLGRHVPEEDAHAQFRRMLGVAAAGAGVSGLVMVTLAGPLSRVVLDWPRSEALLRWAGLLIAASAVEQVILEYLRAREKLTLYVAYQFVQTGATVAAVLIVMLVRHDVVLLVGTLGAIKAVGIAIVAMVVRPPPQPTGVATRHDAPLATLGAMIRFGLPLSIAGFGLWLMNLSDRLVVGHYLPAEDLGRYGAVFLFASLITLMSSPLFLPAYPRLMTAVASGVSARVLDEVRTFHRYVALVTIPAAGVLCLTVGPLAARTGGRGFQVPTALVVMLVLAIGLDQWNGLAQYLLLCHGRTQFMQNVWLGYGALNLLVNIIVVPRYGLNGAAAVTLATFVLLEGHILRAAQRHAPLLTAYALGTTAFAGAASLLAAAAAWPILRLMHDSMPAIVLAALVFALVYGLAMLSVRQVRLGELRFW
jgi:O-antigen/teichoic acid export membrane protein